MTMAPWAKNGTALAVTVGVAYTACALLFWALPDAAVNFMNALAHGLDFRKLQTGSAIFSFSSYLYVLVVMVIWSFLMGAAFTIVSGRLSAVGPARAR